MPPNKKETVIARPHEQWNLPSFLGVKNDTKGGDSKLPISPIRKDFELQGPNLLRTDKDLSIKGRFRVTDQETATLNGQRFNRTEVRGAVTTISTSDYLIAVTALAVAPSIGLPHPSLVGVGKTFVVKDEVGGAGTTTITIRSEGERTIDGAASQTISANYNSMTFYTNGTDWFIY